MKREYDEKKQDEYVKVYLKNLPPVKSQVKVLDELGIVLALQNDSLPNYARYVAMHDRGIINAQ